MQEWVAEHKVKRAAEDADFRASEEAKAALEAQKEKVRRLAGGPACPACAAGASGAPAVWAARPRLHRRMPMCLQRAVRVQVREADKTHREARAALRSAEKLLLDPPPTDKLVLHVRRLTGQSGAGRGRWHSHTQEADCLAVHACKQAGLHHRCSNSAATHVLSSWSPLRLCSLRAAQLTRRGGHCSRRRPWMYCWTMMMRTTGGWQSVFEHANACCGLC